MKWLFNTLFYLSLIFLLFYLFRLDYVIIPEIILWEFFLLSLLFCFTGFFFSCVNWQQVFNLTDHNVNLRLAVVSTGLSIFTKYIPGKLMVVMSRAAYVTNKTGISLQITSSASLYATFLTIWIGTIIGSLVLFTADIPQIWILASISLFLFLLGMIMFYSHFIVFIQHAARLFNIELSIPPIPSKGIHRIIIGYILTWCFWSAGFYFLILSVELPTSPSLMLLFAFPFSTVISIAAIFAPGGLGVRESVLVATMAIYNIPIETATGLALLSRVWFLAGEIFIFIIALIFKK